MLQPVAVLWPEAGSSDLGQRAGPIVGFPALLVFGSMRRGRHPVDGPERERGFIAVDLVVEAAITDEWRKCSVDDAEPQGSGVCIEIAYDVVDPDADEVVGGDSAHEQCSGR